MSLLPFCTSRKEESYEYDALDRLARNVYYNSIGTDFSGTEYTNLTWTQGRRLSSITKGSQTYEYEYDMSGVRSVKIANNERHEYVTQNGSVVRDYVTNASTGAFVRCLDFFYDEAGRPFAMRKYRDSTITKYDTYHYVLNAQGDVVQLNFQGGTVYAQYTYDAYGNVLTKSGSLADVNPLRYRGYYYDSETGFYYLQSRYYDPALGRFINADSYASTGQGFTGYNMFAYCGNNPANSADPSGCRPSNQRSYGHGCIGYTDVEPKSPAEKVSKITRNPKYSKEKWDEYYANGDYDAIYDLCVDYTQEVMAALNITSVREIQFDFSDTDAGSYNRITQILFINLYLLYDRDETLDTIRHELRHCYQWETVLKFYDDPFSFLFGNSQESFITAFCWAVNFQVYIEDGPAYSDQPIENDAWNWASISG